MVYNDTFSINSTMPMGVPESVQTQGANTQEQSVSQNTQGVCENLATDTTGPSMATQHSDGPHRVAHNEGSLTGITTKLVPDTAAGIDGKATSTTSAELQGVTADNRTVSKGAGFLSRIIKNITSKITLCFTKKQDTQSRTVAKNPSSMSFFETFGLYCTLKFSKLSNQKKLDLLQGKIGHISEKYRNNGLLKKEIAQTVLNVGSEWNGMQLYKDVFPNKALWNSLPETTKNEFGEKILSANIDAENRLEVLKEVDADKSQSRELVQEFLGSDAKTKDKIDLLMEVAKEADLFLNVKDSWGHTVPKMDFREALDKFLKSAANENATDYRLLHLTSELGTTIPASLTFGKEMVQTYKDIRAGKNIDAICQKLLENPSKIVDYFGKTGCCRISTLSENSKAKLLENLSKMDLSGDLRLQTLKMCLSWSGNMTVKEQSNLVSQLLNSLETNAFKPSVFQDKLREFTDFSREYQRVRDTILEAISTEDKLTQIAGQLDQVCPKLDQYKQSMLLCSDISSLFESSYIPSFEKDHPCQQYVGLAISQGCIRMHDTYKACIKNLEKYQKIKNETGADPNNKEYKTAIQTAVNGEMELGNVLSEQNKIYQMRNLLIQNYDPQSNTINGVSEGEVLANVPNATNLAQLFGNPNKVDMRAAMQAAGLSLS